MDKYISAVISTQMTAQTELSMVNQVDIEFIKQEQLWAGSDRHRAQSILVRLAQAALEITNMPHFSLPAEFISAVIAHWVHPNNVMLACSVMGGYRSAENVIAGVEENTPSELLFAHTLQIMSGKTHEIDYAEKKLRQKNGTKTEIQ